MQRLDLSLEPSAENLALDEALLEAAEEDASGEVLRLWHFAAPVAVLGRGSKVGEEVDRDFCDTAGVAILRRRSGGASVVAGPGCLMYSLVLSKRLRPELENLDAAHRFVMESLQGALGRLANTAACSPAGVTWQGTCDLTLGDRKFSGNSVRVARDHLLYHGTVLYGADLNLVARCLRMPPRHPEYRDRRRHEDFIANLAVEPRLLCEAIAEAFAADEFADDWPRERTRRLTARYEDPEWTYRH